MLRDKMVKAAWSRSPLAGLYVFFASVCVTIVLAAPPMPSAGAAPEPLLSVPAIDPAALLARDAARKADNQPLQFAEAFAVEASPAKTTGWESLPDGTALWWIRVSAPGALSLNFGFSSFKLPAGARLMIRGVSPYFEQGPFTDKQNREDGQFWSPLVPGEEAIIEVTVPAALKDAVSLNLTSVNRGYRDFFSPSSPDKQGYCNIDVICSEGNSWRDEIRSVGVYTVNGTWTCTGTLVNNARQDFREFFLTAYHCGVDSGNAASVVVYWNYQSPTCGQLSGGSLRQNQSGATFRAHNSRSDFCLIELSRDPNPEYNVYYAGWDRSGTTPASAVAIHHPNTEEKAISFCNSALQSTEYLGTSVSSSANHWRIVDWSVGTTEPGSSGSGLWNASNHLLVGQLHGGYAACGNDLSDWYGKIWSSWTGGGTSSTRLSSWLDPDSTGVTTLQGNQPSLAPCLQDGSADAGSGWRYSPWFGFFNPTYAPWVFHQQHGWMYTVCGSGSSSFLYDLMLGWMWTSADVYPAMFSYSRSAWMDYLEGTVGPRWFYNWATHSWEAY